ncbi:type VI secretion system contractile sheath domain-containing protein [Melittangium boletus]|uniref:type VI secretion system contractile sheath domain-containing protein n=1 Tax=Melittangium boletus TaxID=83453 RepID=UPI003DA69225
MSTAHRLRWLVVGAFHPVPTGQRFTVSADGLGERLALAARDVSVTVADRLGAGDASPYTLSFQRLEDFSLEAILASQPDLRALGALREALSGTRPLAPDEAARLQATVGTGRLAEALRQVRGSAADARRAALAVIDEALHATAEELLHHPLVARLESAWRGLHWLASHCPPGAGMDLEVLDVAPSRLEEALAASLDGPPLLLPDACFLLEADGRPEALARLAALGESASVPLVVGLPLGADDPGGWSALRAEEASRWVCAAVNPVVMRAERRGAVRSTCLASPVFAVAAMLAASFRDTRSLAHMVGPGRGLRAPAKGTRGTGAPTGTEVALSLREQERLRARGLLGVSGWPDSDQVGLLAAPTLHAGRDVTLLPAQVLTGRLVRLALEVSERLPAQATPDEVSTVCARAAAAFLPGGTPGAGCELGGQVVPTGGGGRGLHLRAALRPELAGTLLRLEFTVPLRG